jgi:hypothetical protein
MKTRTIREITIQFVASPFRAAGTKRHLATWIAAAALALLGASPPARAAGLVNVQMNDYTFENGAVQNPYTGQGAVVSPDAHIWNAYHFPGDTQGLVDSTGAPTSVTVTANGDGYTAIDTGNFLLDGSLSEGPGTGISGAFTIGGLVPHNTYILYLYAWNQQGSLAQPIPFGGTFNITSGAGTNTNPQSTTGAALISGVDYTSSSINSNANQKAYIEYANLPANAAGQITGTYRNIFNGLQLLGPTGSIPEPASLSVLGIAAIAGLMRRRSVR